MNAEGEPRPEQGEPPPEALAAGHRMLAAIVFTDTVGFSKLMSTDEERAMRLVGRDLEQMKSTCAAFNGQVLKGTGDGLLMLFTSAVQAVACALEIQRNLHTQNQELPKTERLQHRIGIHLGDVFQNGSDVLGDGVNIAARLETEAVPGGICMSKTVYDVVHNRLPFYVNDLGPRKLKNIGTVTAYQISPTDSGQRYFNKARRWLQSAAVVVIAMVLLFFLFTFITNPSASRKKVNLELMSLAHQLDPSGPQIMAKAPAPGQTTQPVEVIPQLPGDYPAKNKKAATDEDFEIAKHMYMLRYNFGAMIDWLEKYDAPSTDEDKLDVICKSIRSLVGWCQTEIQNYSPAHPLELHKDAAGTPHVCWPTVSGEGFMLRAGDSGTPIHLSREDMPPVIFAEIMAQLIRENAQPGKPSTIQLWRGLRFFVQAYHVKTSPELQKDLDDAAAQDVSVAGAQQVP